MTVQPFDFGDGVPHRPDHPEPQAAAYDRGYRTTVNAQAGSPSKSNDDRTTEYRSTGDRSAELLANATTQTRLFDFPVDDSAHMVDEGGAISSERLRAGSSPPTGRTQREQTHTSAAGKPRNAVRGFSLVLAVVGHAVIGSLIAAGGNLILGAVTSVAIMGCSAALVATEALASQ